MSSCVVMIVFYYTRRSPRVHPSAAKLSNQRAKVDVPVRERAKLSIQPAKFGRPVCAPHKPVVK